MKYSIHVSMLCVAIALVGCSPSDTKPANPDSKTQTVAAKLDVAKQEQKEADRAMEDYTYARKAEFVALMKTELAMIQTELDRLGAKVEQTSGKEKAEAVKQLAAVRKQWADAKARLEQAESATESTWQDMKDGFRSSLDQLMTSFEKTRQWLSDKIEP